MEKQDKPAATTESLATSSPSAVDKTEQAHKAVKSSGSSQAAGVTTYKTRVAEHVVERAIYQVPGTTDINGGLLSRNYPRFDIRLDQERRVASVDAVIAVVWPSPAVRVAAEVRKAIAEALDTYIGYEATRVNVTIGEAVPSKQRITRDDVEARSEFTPRAISVNELEVAHPHVTSKTETLREIETAEAAPLREITISPGFAELTAVETRELAIRRKVETPWPKPLGVISVDDPKEPVRVSAPEARPLAEITVNELPSPRKVEAPKPRTPFSPSVPEQRKLKAISGPKRAPLREISVPQPAALRSVTVGEMPSVSVQAPEPQPLREVVSPQPRELIDVNTRSFALRSVEVPRKRKLRSVSVPKPRKPRPVNIRRKKLRKIQPPKQHALREINVASWGQPRKPEVPKARALRKVRTPMKQQLRKPYAPADHPFRTVTVPKPAPLRAIYRKDTKEVLRDLRGGSRG